MRNGQRGRGLRNRKPKKAFKLDKPRPQTGRLADELPGYASGRLPTGDVWLPSGAPVTLAWEALDRLNVPIAWQLSRQEGWQMALVKDLDYVSNAVAVSPDGHPVDIYGWHENMESLRMLWVNKGTEDWEPQKQQEYLLSIHRDEDMTCEVVTDEELQTYIWEEQLPDDDAIEMMNKRANYWDEHGHKPAQLRKITPEVLAEAQAIIDQYDLADLPSLSGFNGALNPQTQAQSLDSLLHAPRP